MGTSYRVVNWEFDRDAWANAISVCLNDIPVSELAEMLDMSVKGVKTWQDRFYNGEFPHPSMSNFLKVANLLDLDVREFFRLEVAK